MPRKKFISANTHQAKSKLSELLAVVCAGGIVQICRDGEPIAELKAIRPSANPLKSNPKLKKVVFVEDPVLPVSSDDWPEDSR